eukprot:2536274-Alexandrium_andersonii.AAC.1
MPTCTRAMLGKLRFPATREGVSWHGRHKSGSYTPAFTQKLGQRLRAEVCAKSAIHHEAFNAKIRDERRQTTT